MRIMMVGDGSALRCAHRQELLPLDRSRRLSLERLKSGGDIFALDNAFPLIEGHPPCAKRRKAC